MSLPRKIFIVHAVAFETWGPETPDQRGIGQSETANIELAQRLAKRGWDVTCYAPIPDDCPREYKGVHWRKLQEADYCQSGYWLIFRQPECMDFFPDPHPNHFLSIVSQDEDYPGRWNDERCAKLDMLFALCNAHRDSLERDHPALKGKVKVVANGIKLNLIHDAEMAIAGCNAAIDGGVVVGEKIVRDPHRIMWASSPDRGLLRLLKIFRRLREWVSDATLVVTYGFANIDKLLTIGPQFEWMRKAKEEILKDADQPGVIWLDRIPQPQLMREWAKTGLIVYPSLFRETYGSTHCEAQAMGAIPVCSPVWALGEHALAGSLIPGDPADPLVQSRFVSEIFRWMIDTEHADNVRKEMMVKARAVFNWERATDLYERQLLGFGDHMGMCQFNFQLKHCVGADSILNLGCADDPANLAGMGAVNVDLRTEDPIFKKQTKAHIQCDMRDLSPLNGQKFSRIVYGDCLEHFRPSAVPAILREGIKHLAPDGRIVITVPEDYRDPSEQHTGSDGSQDYADDVSAVHLHPVTLTMIQEWLEKAGLEMVNYQEMDAVHYINHGVLARVKETA